VHEENEGVAADTLPPALGRTDTHRPYFEVLIVTGAAATRWPYLGAEWRRLHRPLDAFIYEPVFVGSFEDRRSKMTDNPMRPPETAS
jgi:arginine decarboxylase